MSLDVYLTQDMTYEAWGEMVVREEEVFWRNITHNLTRMADEAGIYEAMWRPEEKGWSKAKDIIPALEAGLNALVADPDRYREFNPANGWGNYETLVSFVSEYLAACRQYPEATIRVSR